MFKTTIKFLSIRRITTILSIVLMILSGSSLVTRGLNPGIDFTGGFQIEVSFQEAPEIQQVRLDLSNSGFDDAI